MRELVGSAKTVLHRHCSGKTHWNSAGRSRVDRFFLFVAPPWTRLCRNLKTRRSLRPKIWMTRIALWQKTFRHRKKRKYRTDYDWAIRAQVARHALHCGARAAEGPLWDYCSLAAAVQGSHWEWPATGRFGSYNDKPEVVTSERTSRCHLSAHLKGVESFCVF